MKKNLMIKLSGKVIKGAKYGRVLGFPTANLDRAEYARRKMKVRLGIYAGWAMIAKSGKRKAGSITPPSPSPFSLRSRFGEVGSRGGKIHKAGIVLGPIDKTGLPKIEAHLIGFKGNLYGKKIIISLEKYIRPFRKFKNVDELKKQIKKDINKINLISN